MDDTATHAKQYVQQLIERSRAAQRIAESFSQERVNELSRFIAWCIVKEDNARALANLALEETQIGDYNSKCMKIAKKIRGSTEGYQRCKVGWNYRRKHPIPITPEEIRADLILFTHDHLDHLDPDIILELAEECVAKFVGPISCLHHLLEIKIDRNRIVELNRGETKVLEEIEISAVHAEHTEFSVGYVLNFNGIKVYISGDTSDHPMLREIASFHPDVVVIGANGKPKDKYYNLDENQAAILTKILNPKVVIPMNYGLFEYVHEDPQKFVDALRSHHVPVECVIMNYKGFYVYKKR